MLLLLFFLSYLRSGEFYSRRTIHTYEERVPSNNDEKEEADAATSLCEDFLEYRNGEDEEPLHHLTFYLYEKDGRKMGNCNKKWSDSIHSLVQWVECLYSSSLWTDYGTM